MAKIITEFPSGIIIKILTATNFTSIQKTAKEKQMSKDYLYSLNTKRSINLEPETIDKIANTFGVTSELLYELQELAQKLELELETRDDLPPEEKERLKLQALAYKVLKHYLNSTNLPTSIKDTKLIAVTSNPQTPNDHFGTILRVIQCMNFITDVKLASISGIKRQTIHLIRKNKTNPQERSLKAISESLNLPIEGLYDLKKLELELREYLETTDIEKNRKELIILQALAHTLLDYYFDKKAKNVLSQKLVKAIKK